MQSQWGGNLHFEGCLSDKTSYYENFDRVDVDCGRSAIQYIAEIENKKNIYLPVYDCPLVNKRMEEAFCETGVKIHYYNMDESFRPIISNEMSDALILFVNYFGVMSDSLIDEMTAMQSDSVSVIIDNIPGYFETPRNGVYNIYSCRKFIGVPDGGHVIKNGIIKNNLDTIENSARYEYLLKSVNVGSNDSYDLYEMSEDMFTESNKPLGMSRLTSEILKTVDYERIKTRRLENFARLHQLLGEKNSFPVISEFAKKPAFVYPLLVTDNGVNVRKKLVENNIYVSTLWRHVMTNEKANDFEKSLANNIVPLPIDQRYSVKDMEDMAAIVINILKEG